MQQKQYQIQPTKIFSSLATLTCKAFMCWNRQRANSRSEEALFFSFALLNLILHRLQVPAPWGDIPMPSKSYFAGFSAPSDSAKWKLAQLQASRGEQILLSKVSIVSAIVIACAWCFASIILSMSNENHLIVWYVQDLPFKFSPFGQIVGDGYYTISIWLVRYRLTI